MRENWKPFEDEPLSVTPCKIQAFIYVWRHGEPPPQAYLQRRFWTLSGSDSLFPSFIADKNLFSSHNVQHDGKGMSWLVVYIAKTPCCSFCDIKQSSCSIQAILNQFSAWSSHSTPVIYPKVTKTQCTKNICTPVFTIYSIICTIYTICSTIYNTPNWKQEPGKDARWKNYGTCIQWTSTMRKDEAMQSAATWIDLENIILSAISQRYRGRILSWVG